MLEGHDLCPLGQKSPLQVNTLQLDIAKNKLTSSGSIVVETELAKEDGFANVDFKQCPTNKTCSGVTSIELKNICNYMINKSIFGNKLMQYFTPPLKCPVKPGTYGFNMTINLKPLSKLPLAKFRTYLKAIMSDKNEHNRKRPLVCFELIVSMKD